MIRERGFSLIEPLLVVAIVALIVLMVNNYPSSVQVINKSRNSSIAREIAAKKIELLRKEGYANLSTSEEPLIFLDPSLNNLPNSEGSFQIENCPITICSLNEKAKKVTVLIKWQKEDLVQQVELNTIVAENGLAQ